MPRALNPETEFSISVEDQCPKPYIHRLRGAFCKQFQLNASQYAQWLEAVYPNGDWLPNEGQLQNAIDMDETTSLEDLLGCGDQFAENRIQTGSYYTPERLSTTMTQMGIAGVISSRNPSLKTATDLWLAGETLEPNVYQELWSLASTIKMMDLACGNGIFPRAFLALMETLRIKANAPMETLHERFQRISVSDLREDALESWAIRGALEVPELLCHPVPLQGVCIDSVYGDDLIAVPFVAETLAAGGYDLLIGNPPYLGEKGNKPLFERLRGTEFGAKCQEGRMDLFYYFFHRAMDLLKPQGHLCQITTSYYATADSAVKLRSRLQQEGRVCSLVVFNDQPVFPEVRSHHLIVDWEKDGSRGLGEAWVYEKSRPLSNYGFEDLCQRESTGFIHHHTEIPSAAFFDEEGQLILQPGPWKATVVQQIRKHAPRSLEEYFGVNQGIVSGLDKSEGRGVFVLTGAERDKLPSDTQVPWFKNSDIRRYGVSESTEMGLLYLGNEPEGEVDTKVLEHLTPYRDKLNQRRECQTGRRPWYGLQWPRNRDLFTGPKLVAPQRCVENRFGYTEKPWFASADVYFITAQTSEVSLLALMGYLNSDCLYYWLHQCGKRKGAMLELYATPLKKIPIQPAWLHPGGFLDQMGQQLWQNQLQQDSEGVARCRQLVESWLLEQFQFSEEERTELKRVIGI